MQRNLRPWVTVGIVIAGATLLTAGPVVAPKADVQHRQLRLVDYVEYDASQLASATEANWSSLETILSSTNWTTDPDISQGLSTLFTDLGSGASNPVTDPFSLLIEGALGLLSGSDASNAASTALTAVTDNTESALTSGDYSTALTDFENAGTTVLYAFLNGYPDSVGSGNDLSPEFGLLTNTLNGAATGQLDGLQQLSNTLADEVSALGGGGLTTAPTVLDPGSLDLSVNLDSILNLLSGGSSDITLPFTLDDIIGDLAGANGDITIPITPDQILTDLGGASGAITIPVTPAEIAQIVGATADANGNIVLPITPDDLLGDVADGNNDISLPLTYDQALTDIFGANGTISIPPISLSTILPENFSVTLPQECINILGEHCVGGNVVSVPDPAYHDTITPPALSVGSIESALGSTGNNEISIPVSSLEGIFGTSGNDGITIPASEIESLLNGTNEISIPVSSLTSSLGDLGSNPLSISASTLDSLLGTAGNDPISIPLSAIEGLLPSTLPLDLDIPGITGGAVPNYDVDLAQDLLAVLGNITPIAQDLPALLGPDPTFDAASLLTSLAGDLGLPVDITGGDLTLNLTGLVAEVLAGL